MKMDSTINDNSQSVNMIYTTNREIGYTVLCYQLYQRQMCVVKNKDFTMYHVLI